MSLKRGSKTGRAQIPIVEMAATPPGEERASATSHTFEFPDQKPVQASVESWDAGQLGVELLQGLIAHHGANPGGRRGSLKNRLIQTHSFVRYMQQRRPGITCLAELTGEDLVAWRDHLNSTYTQGTTAASLYTTSRVVLQHCAQLTDLQENLKYEMHQPSDTRARTLNPRAPYTDEELEQIRAAAGRVYAATRERLQGPGRGMASLTELEQRALRGVLQGTALADQELSWAERQSLTRRPGEAGYQLFPTSAEVVAIIILLAIETGWNPSVICELQADCLVNTDRERGRTGVVSVKWRRGSSAHQVQYVEDGGPRTAGGLIRTMLQLSAGLRPYIESERLWISWVPKHSRVAAPEFANRGNFLVHFCELAGVEQGKEGFPVLQLSRLRKTKIARTYRESGGRSLSTNGHDVHTGARHYLGLPALLDEHLAAIRDGIQEVVAIASPQEVADVPDSFTTGCRDMMSPPNAPKGTLCVADPSTCFGCPNSVVSLRNLPGILSHADQLRRAAQVMSPSQWALEHGVTWIRIHEHVLPKFSAAELESARLLADERPLLTLHVLGGGQ